MQEISIPFAQAPLNLWAMLANLAIGLVLSMLISWHFKRFGSSLSNRAEFAQVFPFVLLTTVLIITIVKSSLALSLGLVGALSIVRFRTPIKEPEELAYLFLTIATGLALGADQTLAAVLATPLILLAMGALAKFWSKQPNRSVFLSLQIDLPDDNSGVDDHLAVVNKILSDNMRELDLRRMDVQGRLLDVSYQIDVASADTLAPAVTCLQQRYPQATVSFLDQSHIPSV